VVEVLQLLVFDKIGISFYITTIVTIVLIWIYTNQGGIKTIIWTDTLQTTFMILTALICIISLFNELGYDSIQDSIEHSSLSLRFFMFDSFREKNHFIRYFLSGMFMAIAMTGLDQDMMQKNLTCKSIVGAQRNIIGLSISLILINLLFLYLGALLYDYASMCNINAQGDKLFTSVIMSNHLGIFVFISFLLGLISAAYSSADSALTSLTTCFCIDFLNIEKESSNTKAIKTRKYVHLLVSILIFCFIVFIKFINQGSIISTLFTFAGYTYGPLLGLFFFGLFTKRKLIDCYVPFVVIISPLLTFGINHYSYVINFEFGYDLLLINGLITFLGLFIISYNHSHVLSNNKLV
jgi:Na+/proline symporter